VDEGAPATVGRRPLTKPENADGLAEQVAAVEAARNQLGRDLDRFNYEVRAQVGQTVEKLMWKLTVIGSGVLSGLIVKKVLFAGWKAARKDDPPANPAAPGTGWADSLAWAGAVAAGASIAKVVAMRGAAAGWEKATGHLPPGIEETSV
jgi:hypothetical protein